LPRAASFDRAVRAPEAAPRAGWRFIPGKGWGGVADVVADAPGAELAVAGLDRALGRAVLGLEGHGAVGEDHPGVVHAMLVPAGRGAGREVPARDPGAVVLGEEVGLGGGG
jgi:hypothetical protein